MSVEIFDVSDDDRCGAGEITIGVSSERFFNCCWEKAITELDIHTLGNGVWLNHSDKEMILEDFCKIRTWAENNLSTPEAEYMTAHIDRTIELLSEWDSCIPQLWMG